jgi:hypothetical protein
MMGPTHRLTGFAAGAGTAFLAGHDIVGVVLSGTFASASSHGGLSPDVDQTKLWTSVRKKLPNDRARLLNHRNLSHWWALPVLAYAAVATLPVEFQWATTMLIVGWASHLFGDLLFGELPLDPWGKHTFGLGLDTGGFLETGTLKLGGKSRKVIPFGPTRALLSVGIALLLVLSLTN